MGPWRRPGLCVREWIPLARGRHAGQLGQGRVPRAPAPHAGALAADLAAQPHNLFDEGLRPPRGPARDPSERYGPYPGLAAPQGPSPPFGDPRTPSPNPGLRPRDHPPPSAPAGRVASLDPPAPHLHCTLGTPLTPSPRPLTAFWPPPPGEPSTHPWSSASPKY